MYSERIRYTSKEMEKVVGESDLRAFRNRSKISFISNFFLIHYRFFEFIMGLKKKFRTKKRI